MRDRRHKWKEHNVDPANTDTTKATATESQILANNDSQSLNSSLKRKVSVSSGVLYPPAKFIKIRPQPTEQGKLDELKKEQKSDASIQNAALKVNLQPRKEVQLAKLENEIKLEKNIDQHDKVSNSDSGHSVNNVKPPQNASDKGLEGEEKELGGTETKDPKEKVMVCQVNSVIKVFSPICNL